MKKLTILIFILFFYGSCKEQVDKSNLSHHEIHPGCKHEEDLAKIRDTFNLKLLSLYNSNLTADKLIFKSDSLIKDFKNSNFELNNEVAPFCEAQTNYFKAEIFFKNGNYQKSIDELNKSSFFGIITGDVATGIAANYVKLGKYDKAKIFVDSIGKGYYLYDYALANYYESIKSKNEAIKIYRKIIAVKAHQNRFIYKSSKLRLDKIKEENPVFLNGIIFPTRKPGEETYNQ